MIGSRRWILMVGSAALLAACGGSGNNGAADAGAGCVATFSGNFADSASAPSCATMASDGGDSTLELVLNSAVAGAPTTIDVELGASPQPGTFSSETVENWDATGINTGDCEFSAGSTAVPSGSFTLTLTSLGTAGDAGSNSPHGQLAVTQYVKAPPSTDCGEGDTEEISVVF